MRVLHIAAIEQLRPPGDPGAHAGGASITPLADIMPADLHSVIGAKGHRYRDDFTKAALYCAKRLVAAVGQPKDADMMGVVCATGYGNFKNGSSINVQAAASPGQLSGQLFPNGTYSSAAVIVSSELGARGVNLTVTAGDVGAIGALALAEGYLRAGRLTDCMILAGDDFAPFTARNAEERCERPLAATSSMGGLFLSSKPEPGGYCLITAYTAMKAHAVMDHLARTLGHGWEQRYLVHTAGPAPVTLNRDCRSLVRAAVDGLYMGPAVTLWQLQSAMDLLEGDSTAACSGAVIFTTATSGALGACVIAKDIPAGSE